MAREDLDLVPIVDDAGALAGVMTERALARRYIRESREPSELDAPTASSAIVKVLEGGRVAATGDAEVSGQIWCMAMDIGALPSEIGPGDVVVVGNRDDAQRAAIELGVGLLVTSNGTRPTRDTLALADERGVPVVGSPLDSYVTARMITLSAPCRALMDPEPLTVRPDDLLSDVADEVKEVHYRAAVAVDARRHPIGLVTRTDLVSPRAAAGAARRPRRAGAERAGRRAGRDRRDPRPPPHRLDRDDVPVRATFDPVGSTATLVIERFRQNGMEPSRSSALLLLCAIMSDTVILNSPTTTERDHAAVEYLGRVLALDPMELGREMFEATSDLAGVSADAIVTRDAKEYEVGGGQTIAIAQVETVGRASPIAATSCWRRCAGARAPRLRALRADGHRHPGQGHRPLRDRRRRPAGARVRREARDGVIALPGVMSRKKQVAPKVLAAL